MQQLQQDQESKKHKTELELMEKTFSERIKLLEQSAAQKENESQRECAELKKDLDTFKQAAEQERSELQAQYEQKLTQALKDRDQEAESLRELQRSVAASIDQMGQFSSRVGELSSHVEILQQNVAQDLQQRPQWRDEDSLNMQNQMKEMMEKIETWFTELKKQREEEWSKFAADQAKVESTRKALEEEHLQNIAENKQLQKEMMGLLKEQMSVMTCCAEERSGLAAEWNQVYAKDKERLEMVLKEVQKQADLKLQAAELKVKEESLTKERATLSTLRDELDREKERMAVEKYKEAKRVEAEHTTRLQEIHMQSQKLQKQQQQIYQDQIRMSKIQTEKERLIQRPPTASISKTKDLPIAETDSGVPLLLEVKRIEMKTKLAIQEFRELKAKGPCLQPTR
ncbi:fas-binding factor 1-like isoform X2 [Thalassophryne amazonica]|uniref:fas-binding factor 1-like isoform X2 n=1 Tax=Thalassophryne amazonica TaxID=390379 RepID=UPI00147206D2|nr:fas-binding factor 1-like isoform X2 [Thalassophryne amazonica]